MARGRSKRRGGATKSKRKPAGSGVGVGGAYEEMLAEVESSPTHTGEEGRVIKKRRVKGCMVAQGHDDSDRPSTTPRQAPKGQGNSSRSRQNPNPLTPEPDFQAATHQEQIAYKEESSEESDFAWEEVDLAQGAAHDSGIDQAEQEEGQDLQLVFHGDAKPTASVPTVNRRKPLTAIEKKLRLELHKVHMLSLLSHVHLRNHWCNDQNVHKIVYRRLPKQVVALLNPNESQPDFRQDEQFREGLKKASSLFHDAFTITARGMSRPYWTDDPHTNGIDPPSDLDLPMQKSDFLDCAKRLEGSRDVSAQLFCALLRATGVETRLVCSLQVLPLTAATKPVTLRKPLTKAIPVIDHNPPSSDTDSDHPAQQRSSPAPSKRPIGSTGGLTRFSDPNAPPAPPPLKPCPKRKRKIIESPHPIFWLEVLHPLTQKYIPLDPLVTHSIGKPSLLSPSLSDPMNAFAYVMAFNDDLTIKDVTRRYTRQFVSKILRTRVDVTEAGKIWLNKVMKLFQYPSLIRTRNRKAAKDEAEDAELLKREKSEPMPTGLQDFKHHPLYALERHLHRNEMIHPRTEIGRISSAGVAGGRSTVSGKEPKMESVFPRSSVLVCRSAAAWFRQGKVVKEGEQPIKRLAPKQTSSRRRDPEPFSDDEDEDNANDRNLYAPHQTCAYEPPAIPPSGRPIPRNAFGNLDIYVPSMIPLRGYHSPSPLTATAAKILGIEYVDAVTGFSYRGRRGAAIVTGAVVWEGHREAVEVVIGGLEEVREEEERERRTGVVLGVWKRMVVGLRVRERVRGYEIEGEVRGEEEQREGGQERSDEEGEEEGEEAGGSVAGNDLEGGGGFLDEHNDGEGGGGFIPDESSNDEGGGFLPDPDSKEALPTAARRIEDEDNDEDDSDVYMPSDRDRDLEDDDDISARYYRSTRKQPRRDRNPTGEPSPTDHIGGGFIIPSTNNKDETGGDVSIHPSHEPSNTRATGQSHDAQKDLSSNIKETSATAAPTAVAAATGSKKEKPFTASPPPSTLHQVSTSLSPVNKASGKSIEPHPPPPPAAAQEKNIIAESIFQLTDAEIAEAIMLQQMYEGNKSPDADAEAPTAGSETDEPEQETGKSIAAPQEVVEGASDEDREDKGSLLSEDPADEDAEPEWLA